MIVIPPRVRGIMVIGISTRPQRPRKRLADQFPRVRYAADDSTRSWGIPERVRSRRWATEGIGAPEGVVRLGLWLLWRGRASPEGVAAEGVGRRRSKRITSASAGFVTVVDIKFEGIVRRHCYSWPQPVCASPSPQPTRRLDPAKTGLEAKTRNQRITALRGAQHSRRAGVFAP